MDTAGTMTYYFISDLHIGGDAGLNEVDFETEMIGFLSRVREGPRPAELIIAGDLLGLWELTTVEPFEKVRSIIDTHPELFEAFRATGAVVPITLIAGNHDYDLICIPAFREELAAWNIRLDPGSYLTREIAGRKIWVEHGHLHDDFTRYARFKDRFSVPIGYYVTRTFSSTAARSAPLGRSPWLADLESVYPNEEIHRWALSNYFYREMSPILRWLMAPFLALFGFTVIAVIGTALEEAGLIATTFFSNPGAHLGFPGRVLDWIMAVDAVVLSLLLLLSVPFYVLSRDVRRTLRRFGLNTSKKLTLTKDDKYRAAARRVFGHDPRIVLYVYGHTHIPSLARLEDGRCIVNTGTWLKRLERTEPHLRLFPSVYLPSYQLNYFTVTERDGSLVLSYTVIPKEAPPELTFLQKMMVLGKRPRHRLVRPIPAEVIIP